MDETKRSILVGLFMIAAIAALGSLVIIFGENPGFLGGARYQVIARFDDIEGVSQGTRVLMRGITIGEIEKLRLVDPAHPEQGVDVILRIENQYPLRTHAEALVLSSLIGLTGQGTFKIEIPPGASADTLPKDGTARIRGRMVQADILPGGMMKIVQETLENVSALAAALRPVADDLHVLFEARPVGVDAPSTRDAQATEQLTANVSTAVQRLNDVLENLNEVIGDPAVKKDLRDVIGNLATASGDLKQIVADLKPFPANVRKLTEAGHRTMENLDKTIGNANHQVTDLGQGLKSALGQLEGVLKNFDRITRSIADGEGTAGKFVRDERLYESLLLTVDRMKKAIADFQVLIKKLQEKGLLG